MTPVFETSNLAFLDIIHYPDLVIEKNKATFLTGPSGCGKSTLLRLFNKTASPASGKVLFYKEDIASMNTLMLRQRVLLVGQSVFLFSTSIADNFNQFFAYRGQTPPGVSEMKKYLAICRADFPLDARCETLSGGERQRVFLAVCLAMQPEVLLLDEPSSALDRNHADAVIAGIKAWAHENNVTLVVVSHDPVLTGQFADCTLNLAGGKTQ